MSMKYINVSRKYGTAAPRYFCSVFAKLSFRVTIRL